jgi:hypothetical protein
MLGKRAQVQNGIEWGTEEQPHGGLLVRYGFKFAKLRLILTILEDQQHAIQKVWKNHFQR